MKSIRPWVLGTAVVMVAVIALGWILGISPKLAEIGATNEQLSAVNAENVQHQAELLSLKTQFENIDELRSQLETLQASIPADVGSPDFIRQLNSLAVQSGVTITSITTDDPLAYALPSNPGSMLDADGNEVPLPVAPATLNTVKITIDVKGSWGGVLAFSQGLQSGKRLFLITNMTLGADEGAPPPPEEEEQGNPAAPLFKGNIIGLIYVLPQAAPAS